MRSWSPVFRQHVERQLEREREAKRDAAYSAWLKERDKWDQMLLGLRRKQERDLFRMRHPAGAAVEALLDWLARIWARWFPQT